LKKNHPIVIIGGNDAGLAAAGRSRRVKPESFVLVYEKDRNLGFASCGLPYYLSDQLAVADVQGMDSDRLLHKRGIQALTEHEVLEIEAGAKRLLVLDKANNVTQAVHYQKLIIASGARPTIPKELDGFTNVFALRHFSHAQRMHFFLTDHSSKNVLVIGGGLLGLEIAEALTKKVGQVFLVDADRVLAHLPATLSDRLVQRLSANGLTVYTNTTINEWQKSSTTITGFKRQSSPTYQALDAVFVSCGIEPDSLLAKKAGLRLGVQGAIKVNPYQQTSRADIFAAGDCCETRHLVNGKPAWLPFAGPAARQGRVAGENAVGGTVQFPGSLGTRMARIFGLEFGMTGLTFAEAMTAGFAAKETIIQQSSQSEYMPGSHKIDMQVVWDGRSNRVLGGAVLGENGAGLRLNQLAIVVQAKLTIKDLLHLDLGYTPAINHMMDPLHIIGSMALKQKKERE
jgi:NADPH-dependent 2,4-dienoyl-CoA reductase/sulfur reductase-like enzyme